MFDTVKFKASESWRGRKWMNGCPFYVRGERFVSVLCPVNPDYPVGRLYHHASGVHIKSYYYNRPLDSVIVGAKDVFDRVAGYVGGAPTINRIRKQDREAWAIAKLFRNYA